MNSESPATNEISIAALKNGDRAEFAKMVDAYSGRIYSLAMRILGDQRDAEDTVQETFLKAYKAIGAFEGRSSLATWLYRIATNESLMIIRRRKPEVTIEKESEEDQMDTLEKPDQFNDWCCLPEKEFQSSELRGFMDKAVKRLSPALRVVFTLRDIQGLSVKETAEILNVTEGVVKTRLLRARLQLREDLSTYFNSGAAEGEWNGPQKLQ